MALENEQILKIFDRVEERKKKSERLMKSAEVLYEKGFEDKSAQVIYEAKRLNPGIILPIVNSDVDWSKPISLSRSAEDLAEHNKKNK